MNKISIITVCYNAKNQIEQTIRSVTNQSYQFIEYIIIDGQSLDGTQNIINNYLNQIDHFIEEIDHGIYDAMNKGMALATGDFLLFLNAGDTLDTNNTIEQIMKYSKESDILYGETYLVDGDRNILGTRSKLTTKNLPDQLEQNSFLDGQPVSHQSFIVKKKIVDKFQIKYKCSADIDWMIRATMKASIITNVNLIISRYLLGGVSDKNLQRCWIERFHILLEHFSIYQVLTAHIRFALRYLRFGAYKIK